MAAIVLKGPKALDVARAFKKGMGFPCWDLSPDIAEAVRIDVSTLTPRDAIDLVNKVAADPEIRWISHGGWVARFQTPVEADIEGTPL